MNPGNAGVGTEDSSTNTDDDGCLDRYKRNKVDLDLFHKNNNLLLENRRLEKRCCTLEEEVAALKRALLDSKVVLSAFLGKSNEDTSGDPRIDLGVELLDKDDIQAFKTGILTAAFGLLNRNREELSEQNLSLLDALHEEQRTQDEVIRRKNEVMDRIQRMEEENLQNQTELQTLHSSYDLMESQLASREQQLKKLRAELDDQKKEKYEIQSELERANVLIESVNDVKKAYNSMSKNLSIEKQKRAEAENGLAEAENRYSDLEKVLDDMIREKKLQSGELMELRNSYEERVKRIAEINDEYKRKFEQLYDYTCQKYHEKTAQLQIQLYGSDYPEKNDNNDNMDYDPKTVLQLAFTSHNIITKAIEITELAVAAQSACRNNDCELVFSALNELNSLYNLRDQLPSVELQSLSLVSSVDDESMFTPKTHLDDDTDLRVNSESKSTNTDSFTVYYQSLLPDLQSSTEKMRLEPNLEDELRHLKSALFELNDERQLQITGCCNAKEALILLYDAAKFTIATLRAELAAEQRCNKKLRLEVENIHKELESTRVMAHKIAEDSSITALCCTMSNGGIIIRNGTNGKLDNHVLTAETNISFSVRETSNSKVSVSNTEEYLVENQDLKKLISELKNRITRLRSDLKDARTNCKSLVYQKSFLLRELGDWSLSTNKKHVSRKAIIKFRTAALAVIATTRMQKTAGARRRRKIVE